MAGAESEVYTFDRLQEEIGEWAARNFPDSGAAEQFLGVVEELGELAGTLLPYHAAAQSYAADDEKDAIGDICIFLLNYCNHREINISGEISKSGFDVSPILDFQESAFMLRVDPEVDCFKSICEWVGTLAHSQLKAKQGIRGVADIHRANEIESVIEILVAIALHCERRSYSLETILSETWSSVSKRDWIANPSTGAA